MNRGRDPELKRRLPLFRIAKKNKNRGYRSHRARTKRSDWPLVFAVVAAVMLATILHNASQQKANLPTLTLTTRPAD